VWKYLNPFSILIQQATAVTLAISFQINFSQKSDFSVTIWFDKSWEKFHIWAFWQVLWCWIELWTRYCQSNHSKNHAVDDHTLNQACNMLKISAAETDESSFICFIKFGKPLTCIFKVTNIVAILSKSRGNCLETDQSTWTVRGW